MTNKDGLGVFLLKNYQRTICPLASKQEIDIINFPKDLYITIENLFIKEKIELNKFNLYNNSRNK